MGNRGSRPRGHQGNYWGGCRGGSGIGGRLGRIILEELLREVVRTAIDNNRDNHDNKSHVLKRSKLSVAMQAPGSDITGKSNDELRQLGISEDKLEQLAIEHGYTVKE